jgi:hypothetical protein
MALVKASSRFLRLSTEISRPESLLMDIQANQSKLREELSRVKELSLELFNFYEMY